MSKYRVELHSSRILLFVQLGLYVIFLFSIFSWQPDVLPSQLLVQLSLAFGISLFMFYRISRAYQQPQPIIIFSEKGDWLECNNDQQLSYRLSQQSRVTSVVLFVHLVPPLAKTQAKRRLIFKDQLSEQDYRRMCRAIFYQQQSLAKT